MRIAAFLLLAAGLVGTATAQTLSLETVTSGLERPVYVTHAPGDYTRLFVLEKRGRVRVIKDGTLLATPFIDVDAEVGGGTSDNSEQGLLGMAFHPNYQTNGYFYLFFTRNNGATAVYRYSVTANPDVADGASGLRLIAVSQPQSNHNGGWIGFGPDGYLYVSIGDGGGGGDDDTGHTPGVGNGQDATNLLGAMLRIDIDGDDFPTLPNTNYAIPATNPFVGTANAAEIWAYGLRNAWRCSFDRETGDLWLGDVGQFSWEEVSFQPASSTGGENYGWRCREGMHNFNTSGDCSQTPFTEPIYEFSHGAGRCSITGGYVYRGCAMPALTGTYFVSDYCAGNVYTFEYDGATVSNFQDRTALDTGFGMVSFGEDAFGELYVVQQQAGTIYRIVPDGVPSACNECVDFNGDFQTNLSDLATVLANFGTPIGARPSDGDTDNDGDVDLTDLANTLADFGCVP